MHTCQPRLGAALGPVLFPGLEMASTASSRKCQCGGPRWSLGAAPTPIRDKTESGVGGPALPAPPVMQVVRLGGTVGRCGQPRAAPDPRLLPVEGAGSTAEVPVAQGCRCVGHVGASGRWAPGGQRRHWTPGTSQAKQSPGVLEEPSLAALMMG